MIIMFIKNRLNFLLFLPLFTAIGFAQNPQSTDTLRLLFSGDIMGHESQILAAKTGWFKYDYRPCFAPVKPLLESADLAIGNLEVTLPGHWPYTGFQPLPVFRSPDALAEGLKEAGFDVLLTANNHSNDSQRRGIRHTIKTLRRLGIHQTGTFLDACDRENQYPLMVEKKGFRLAFLNATFGTNGIPTVRPTIVNRIDTAQMRLDLQKARLLNPDFIVVVLHWGIEHSLETSATQRNQAEFLIKNGADLIVGMHPHVVQPIEKMAVEAAAGSRREAVVAYSLGNFVSNHQMVNADGGLLFRIDLVRKTGEKKAQTGPFGWLPIWRFIHENGAGKKSFQVLPVAELEANPSRCPELDETSRKKMLAFAAGIRQRLACPEWK